MEVADNIYSYGINFGIGVKKAHQGRDRVGVNVGVSKNAIRQMINQLKSGNLAQNFVGARYVIDKITHTYLAVIRGDKHILIRCLTGAFDCTHHRISLHRLSPLWADCSLARAGAVKPARFSRGGGSRPMAGFEADSHC